MYRPTSVKCQVCSAGPICKEVTIDLLAWVLVDNLDQLVEVLEEMEGLQELLTYDHDLIRITPQGRKALEQEQVSDLFTIGQPLIKQECKA